MRTRKIFIPIIAVGLAMSLSVGAEKNQRDFISNPYIDIGTTPIADLHLGYFPNGATSPHIYYDSNGNPLESLRLHFSDSSIPSPLSVTYDSSNPQNASLNLGNSYWTEFHDFSGAWVNAFIVDLARTSSPLGYTIVDLSFSRFSGFENNLSQKKSTFSIINSQNPKDTISVAFRGGVLSDFIINSQSSNTISFSNNSPENVTGNINISGSNSKNIFNFNNVIYTGTFTNAISTDTVINLDGSNTQFIGDINTTGGNTTVNFLTSGVSFQGNITANGGNNTLAFSSGSFDLSALSSSGYKTSTTIQALNNSTNTININGNVRIDNGFYLKGSGNSNGDNIINIANGGYLDTYFHLSSGLTKINFLGSSGGTSSNLYSYSQTNWQNTGSSIITFAKNGTFHIPGASVPYGSTMTHTFIIDKTIVLDDDFYAGSMGMNGPGEWSGVTFQIEDAGELKFEKNNALTTLYTYEGSTTYIAFNGTSGSFSGNLNPYCAETKITFKQDGVFGFSGIIYGSGKYDPNQQIQNNVNDFIINHNITFNSQLIADTTTNHNSSKGNVFLISDQKTLAFSNSTNTAYLKTIGGNTQLIFKGISGGFGGNLIAEGGNNEFVFENAGTFGFSNATLTANEGSQNLFTIDKNITFNTDLSLNGNATQNGGNIFNISSGKTLSFKNGSSLTTLTTSGGITQLNFNGSNGNFEGNISTTEGSTQLNLNENSISLSGNIQTDGGQTLLSISQSITTLNLDTTFTANSSGINKINFSNTKPLTITSENDLILKGNATYESGGGNIIFDKGYPSPTVTIQDSAGEKQNIITQSGFTVIDSIGFDGDIKTLGGNTLFNDYVDNGYAGIIIKGNIVANGGDNIIDGIAIEARQWLAYGNSRNIFKSGQIYPVLSTEYTILGGDNSNGGNIFYIEENGSIYVGDTPSNREIRTIGGLTKVIFTGSNGLLEGWLSADGGNNEIIFEQDGTPSFYLNHFEAKGTSTNTFQVYKNTKLAYLELDTDNPSGGNIINIENKASLSITDGSVTPGNLVSTGGGKNIVRFKGSSGKLYGNFYASTANNDIIFSQSGIFSIEGKFYSESDTYNRFLISNNNVVISTSLTASSCGYAGDGNTNFIISNGGSLSFLDKNSKTSLITSSGETSIEFDDYGSLSGILQTQGGTNTIYFKNTGSTSPYAILDVDFQANNGKNIITITSNGTILKSNNGLQFSSTSYGSNIIAIQGDNSSLSLQNVSNNQIQAINSHGTSEIHFIGNSQSFEGNINSLSGEMEIILGGQSKTNTEIIGKATINGNITANGGNNTFSFLYDGSTLSLGADSQIIANSTSTNTFTIDRNITFLTDISLSGDATKSGGNVFNISSTQALTLKDSSNNIKTINTSGGLSKITFESNGNLIAHIMTSAGKTDVIFHGDGYLGSNTDGVTNISASNSGINTLLFEGSATVGNISSSDSGSNTLTINGIATLGDISSTGGSNTINLSGGGELKNVIANGGSNTINLGENISTLAITSNKSITATQGNNIINIASPNFTLIGNIASSQGNNTINLNKSGGTLDLRGAVFSITANKNNYINLNDSGTFIIATATNAEKITFNLATSGAQLNLGGNFSTLGTSINFKANNTTLISGITTTAGTTTLTLDAPTTRDKWTQTTSYIQGAISTNQGAQTRLVFANNNQRLVLKDNAHFTTIDNISKSNNGISFYHDLRSSKDFKTLTIGTKDSADGISGEGLNFVVYATTNETHTKANNPAYSDKVVIHSSSNAGSSTHNLGVRFENQDTIDLGAITYTKGGNNNILVASVAKSSKVSFNTQESLVLGFDVANVQYAKEDTDENGNIQTNGTYTSYFIGSAKVNDIVVAEQEITATAFTLNYDLYMANFNSLNKRMGELRENPHSQGVWARVFNGGLSNDFGLGSKSNYTTIQAGYDYAFGGEGANNYLGVALSYALSTSTSNNAYDINGEKRSIEGIYSNAFEVAVYNSYVSDIGWYNDTIAKFSYLLSNFNINNLNNGKSTSNDTHNFALTLSDEVGYQFALGGNNEWSIAPQLELGFGYFNQSDFKQTLQNSGAYLSSSADAVLTLRARAGSSFGYDFKNFTQESSFNVSVYAGVFYEYDYLSGGEIQMQTQRGTQTNQYSNLTSDGRVVMNVGTNMSVGNHTRIYFDFEKSFMGKINTDYQVNLGVRYSFGESNGYTPQNIETQEESKAPLKIEEKEKMEENNDEEKQEDIPNKENKKQEEK